MVRLHLPGLFGPAAERGVELARENPLKTVQHPDTFKVTISERRAGFVG